MCIPCVDPVASSGCSVAIGRRALVLPPRCQRTRVTRVQATSSPSDVDVTKENHGGDRDTHRMRRAVLTATKEAAVPIVERERPLREYMALPASQYSVLDARKIERIDDATFKFGTQCYVGELKFFSFHVEPVITVAVETTERGCNIKLLGCELQGSRVVEAQNEKFTATMLNSVEWREAEPGDHLVPRFQAEATKEICSKTTLTIELIVPPWFPLTVGAIEKSGSRVMQSVVNRMVPRFLSQLGKDYRLWASGDESRKPLGDGVL